MRRLTANMTVLYIFSVAPIVFAWLGSAVQGKCPPPFEDCDQSVHYEPVSLGELCSNGTSDVRIYCNGFGVDINCDQASGKCVCVKGYEADSSGTTCSPKRRQLSDACQRDEDCHVAFSKCAASKCQCIDDFVSTGDKCVPEGGYPCPIGKALTNTDGTGFRECSLVYKDYVPSGDSCPSGYKCVLHLQSVSVTTGQRSGHCCPQSTGSTKALCPVGKPLVNGTCPDMSQVPQDAPYTGPPISCPHTTHDCYGSLCCPIPCRGYANQEIDGKCYSREHKGHPCQIDAQCVQPATKCVADKAGAKICQ